MICPTCNTEVKVMRSPNICKACHLAKSAIDLLTGSRVIQLPAVLKRFDVTKSELSEAVLKYNGNPLESYKRVILSTIPREELQALAEKNTTSQMSVLLGFGEPYIRATLIKHGIRFTTTASRRGRPALTEEQKERAKVGRATGRSKRVDTKLTKQFDQSPDTYISPVYERPIDRAKRLGYID